MEHQFPISSTGQSYSSSQRVTATASSTPLAPLHHTRPINPMSHWVIFTLPLLIASTTLLYSTRHSHLSNHSSLSFPSIPLHSIPLHSTCLLGGLLRQRFVTQSPPRSGQLREQEKQREDEGRTGFMRFKFNGQIKRGLSM